jgi:hypothetical protein
MAAFLFMVVVFLLIFAGVVISVRLYTRGAVGTGRLRRIRRLRTFSPRHGSTEIEETVEEIIDEEVPV